MTIVSAPAGYGKTTLLAQWFRRAQAGGEAVAWVSLDETDSQPQRLLWYLAAAFQRAAPELDAAMQEILGSIPEQNQNASIHPLLYALEQTEREVYLIIDDAHLVRKEEARSLLGALAAHPLPHFHLILVCRDIPDVPLARVRMQGTLLELGVAELQFQADEAHHYFTTQTDISLDDGSITTLHSHTDGWIAGLQLAALSLRDHPDPAAFIAAFSGEHRDVGDLLEQEVLVRQPADVVDFLERTSILHTFNASLCNALTDRTDSQTVLARLEASNFFTFPVDDDREFYRYHPLFSEFLQHALIAKNPDLVSELHHRAAQWYLDNDQALQACHHALEAGDAAFAASVLAATATALVEMGAGTSLVEYAESLPENALIPYPSLQLKRVYSYTLLWRFAEAKRVLQSVRQALMTETSPSRSESDYDQLYRELIHRDGQLALLSDDIPRAARLCEEWLTLEGNTTSFDLAVAKTSLLYAQREQYNCRGLEAVPDIRELFVRHRQHWATVWHDTIIGGCYLHTGQLDGAETCYRRALETAVRTTGRLSPTAAIPGLSLAELLYEKNLLDEVQELLQTYLPLATETGISDQLIAGFVTQARLTCFENDHNLSATIAILDTGEAVAHRRSFSRLHAHLMRERLQCLLMNGQVSQAFQIARADDIAGPYTRFLPAPRVTTVLEQQALSWAMVAMAKNRVPDAVTLLERWFRFTAQQESFRAAIRVGMQLIRAFTFQGNTKKAQRVLRTALHWGAQFGFVRSFIDAGEPIKEILNSLPVEESDETLAPYTQQLLTAFGQNQHHEPKPAEFVITEPLNPREAEILTLVEQGLMNRHIADNLGLTVGTVKWYLQQIFGKLGVKTTCASGSPRTTAWPSPLV